MGVVTYGAAGAVVVLGLAGLGLALLSLVRRLRALREAVERLAAWGERAVGIQARAGEIRRRISDLTFATR